MASIISLPRLVLTKPDFSVWVSQSLKLQNRCASKLAVKERTEPAKNEHKSTLNDETTGGEYAAQLDRKLGTQRPEVMPSQPAHSNTEPEVKPFSAMPGPKGLPLVGSLFDMLKMLDKWHILHEHRKEQYGLIWKEPLPEIGPLVMIASVQGTRDFMRNEGQTPSRLKIPIWLEYYKTAGHSLGILQTDGEKWRKMRKVVDKPILRPREIAKHVANMHAVAKDFVASLDKLIDEEGNLNRIDLELFKYTLETAGVVLYDRRFGCLLDQPPPMTTKFINSVRDMFQLSGELMLHSPYVVRMLKRKTWRKYQECWDNIFKIAIDTIDEKIEAQDSLSADSFIGYILSRDGMTRRELYSSVTEIMLASVDTTSNILHAAMYEIARRPDVQEKIYKEMGRELPKGAEVSYDNLEKLPYLKGVIKEVLRLYPTVYGVSRILDSDQVISGYHVPKGTTVSVAVNLLGRNPEIFENPTELSPERWMRTDDRIQAVDPFAWIPFGFGQRSCVGRRLATVEMQLLLAEVVSKYKLSTSNTSFPLKSRVLLTPAEPVHLTLTPRI